MGVNGLVITGTRLDSPKDVDWFVFTAPDMSDFEKMKLDTKENPNVKIQLYRLGGGTLLIEVKSANGIYFLQEVNYRRVTDSGNDFSAGYVCKEVVDTLHIRTTNLAWTPEKYQSASADGVPAVDGVAICILDPSVGCLGTSSGVNMDFDEPCTLNMWSDRGFATSTGGAMPIFVTSRIMG